MGHADKAESVDNSIAGQVPLSISLRPIARLLEHLAKPNEVSKQSLTE